jgi:hypothetical protein
MQCGGTLVFVIHYIAQNVQLTIFLGYPLSDRLASGLIRALVATHCEYDFLYRRFVEEGTFGLNFFSLFRLPFN